MGAGKLVNYYSKVHVGLPPGVITNIRKRGYQRFSLPTTSLYLDVDNDNIRHTIISDVVIELRGLIKKDKLDEYIEKL